MKKTLGFICSFSFLSKESEDLKITLDLTATLNLVPSEKIVLVIKPEDVNEMGYPQIQTIYNAVLMGYQEIEDPIRKEFFGQWLDTLRNDTNASNRFAVPSEFDSEGTLMIGMKKIKTEGGYFFLKLETIPVVMQD